MTLLPKPSIEDLELYIAEFSSDSRDWFTASMQSITRSYDLSVRNNDRSFNVTLSLTTLGSAFLAIVVPLSKDSISGTLAFTILFFFLSVVLGIIFLLGTIKRDQRLIDEDSALEHNLLQKYRRRCTAIRSNLFEYRNNPTDDFWDRISIEIQKYFTEQDFLNNFVEKRQAQKEQEFSSKILRFLRNAFLFTVAIGFILLLLWLIQTKNILYFMDLAYFRTPPSVIKVISIISISFEIIGAIILAMGAAAFFSDNQIANQAVLRIPRSSSDGPPTQEDLLNSFRGKELIAARRHARTGTLLIIFGLLIEVILIFFSH